MLFRTKDVLAYDAPSSNLHKFDSNEVLLKTANEMVDMQKMAFVQSKEFNPESLTTDSVLKPNKSLVCKRPHDRLVSTRERVLKKQKTQKTCRFCHSFGKISTAQRKQLISGYVMDNLLSYFK